MTEVLHRNKKKTSDTPKYDSNLTTIEELREMKMEYEKQTYD